MAPTVDTGSLFSSLAKNSQYSATRSQAGTSAAITDDFLSLVRKQSENRMLNTQALIEYRFLKSRLFGSIVQMNKFLPLDDQIAICEYMLCASLSYRKRVFVMEFRQVSSTEDECNHALELIFRPSADDFNNAGHSTLVLTREYKQFIWRQLQYIDGGPAGTSKSLVGLILRWLQNDNSLYLRTAPPLSVS